jgi:hypothetical protein
MGKNRYPKPMTLTLAQQRMGVSSNWPGFRYSGNHKIGIWIGSLNPGDLYEIYQVKIEYRPGLRPKLTVLSPKLCKRDDQSRIPHVYSGDHPCVYFPTTGEWHPGKLIAKTIIPWLSSWLYYYEVWLVTGKWKGGGIEHVSGEKV